MTSPQGSKITALIETVDHFDPLTDEQRHAAALVVCGNAVDADEAHTFMAMLGLLPGQEDEDRAIGLAHPLGMDR